MRSTIAVCLSGLIYCAASAQTLVQQHIASNGYTVSLPVTIAAPQAGDLLVVNVSCTDASQTISSVTGGGVTWVRAAHSNTHAIADVWYGPNSSGSGTTVTVATTSNTNLYATVTEWSGMTAVAIQDGSGGSNNGASATLITATLTTANANDLIIGTAVNTAGFTASSGPTNSFIALNTPGGTVQYNAYRVGPVAGNYSTSWTTSGSAFWDTAIAAFKAAPAATTARHRLIYR